MLILAVFAAFVFALLRGGSLRKLERSAARGFALAAAGFLCKLAATLLCPRFFPRAPYFALLLTLSYLLCFAFVFVNRRYRLFALLFGAGALANFAVIAANDFYMPVRAAAGAGVIVPPAQSAAYRLADASTRLAFLGDVLYVPLPLLRGFASVGDVLMAAGVFVLVAQITRGR